MGNRTARWPAAALAILAFALLFATAPTPAMAQHCTAAPSSTAPQGLHWYYRVDRSSGRHCWYLAARGSRVTRHHRAGSRHSLRRQSTREAHAEVSSAAPERTLQPSRPAPVLAQAETSTNTAPVQATEPTPAPETAASPDTQPAQPTADATADAMAMAPAADDVPAAEPKVEKSISMKMLLAVLGGVLILAGVIGSFAARLGSGSVPADQRIRLQPSGEQRWPTSGAPNAAPPLRRNETPVEEVPLAARQARSTAARASRPAAAPVEDRTPAPAARSDSTAPPRASTRSASSAATFRAPAPKAPSRARATAGARTEIDDTATEPVAAAATRAPTRSARAQSRAEASRTTRQETRSESPSEARPETKARSRATRPAKASDKPETPTLDLDAITTVLERLAEPQPRPASATDSEDYAQNRRGRFGARA